MKKLKSYQGKSQPSKIQLGRLFFGKQKLVAATKQAPPEHEWIRMARCLEIMQYICSMVSSNFQV